jgi:hypothetical protein
MTDRDDNAPRTHAEHGRHEQSLFREFLLFVRDNWIWWVSPIAIILLVMVTVALLSGPVKLPFIYR